MPTPPRRSLAYPADIIPPPPDIPIDSVGNPTDSLATTPIPDSLFLLPGSPIQSYTADQKAYAKAQLFRCLPSDSSPLMWTAHQRWIWEDGEWIEQISMDQNEDIEMDHGDVEDFEVVLSGMFEQPIYPPTAPNPSVSALPSTTDCPPSPRPAKKEINPSLNSHLNGSGHTKIRIKTPKATKQEMMRGWIERNTSVSIKDNISVSPGSSRTKIVIRRSPPGTESGDIIKTIPASSAALAHITQKDGMDADTSAIQSPINPSILDFPLSSRKSYYPDLKIKSRFRFKPERRSDERTQFTLGGRTKAFARDDWYIHAILYWWRSQVSLRMSLGDIYVAMGVDLPTLASPPPGLDRMPGLAKWIAPPIKAIRPAPAKPKRSRHSPDEATTSAEEEMDVDREKELKSPSPSEGHRKRGKVSADELLSAVMTRQPSPTFGPPEPIDQTDTTRWALPYPVPSVAELSTENPHLDATRYHTNPRTGRREPLPARIELPKPPVLLASHFSPDTPISAERPWEFSHIEHSDDASSASTPSGSSIQRINRLGLDLGANESGWSSSVCSTPDMGSSGNQTPILPSDIARADQEMIAESRRVQLCDAIEKLAAEWTDGPSQQAEWTPPMREAGIDDTPSTVAEELITTPDVDMADLPMSTNSTPSLVKSSDSDEEEEVPRPRLDKGKGRARPEDDMESAWQLHMTHMSKAMDKYRQKRSRQRADQSEDNQATLEGLVMEVSKLEAEEAELAREGGESPDGPGMLQRKISKLNRRIKDLSESLGFVSHLETDVEMVDSSRTDESFAAKLQRDYEEEDAMWELENTARPALPSSWEGLGGVPMSRVQSARSTEPGYQYNPYIPQSLQNRQSITARQLTFGDEEELVSDPITRRGPVSQLLDRSSIFDIEPNPPPHSFHSGGIRLSGRNRSTSTAIPLIGPIKPPTLYPIQQATVQVQITVTPPTPLEHIPPRPSRLRARIPSSADSLEMSALAGALVDKATGLGIQVELELEEDLEMEEAIEDTGSDSESSDETIRQRSNSGEATSITRTLSQAFETPTVGRGKAKRRLEEDEEEEELMEYSPPTFQEEPVRPQRPARVLFGSPRGEI